MIRRDADTLSIEGPVTMQTVPALMDEAGPHLRDGITAVSFAGATEVDSSAVALALEWRRQAAGRSTTLRLENLPQAMVNLAALYGVDELLRAEAA